MRLHPILSSLSRHKITASLLVLDVTFTCAIVCNVAFMMVHRSALMRQPSGIAEDALVMIDSTATGQDGNLIARRDEDLIALRSIAGVDSAAAVSALTFRGDDSIDISPAADDTQGAYTVNVSLFGGTPGELATLGLRLIEGRDFSRDEYIRQGEGADKLSAAIITRALAGRMFHGRNALGRYIYVGDRQIRIVGVIERLLRPQPLHTDSDENEYSMLVPMLPDRDTVTFVLRTAPQDRQRVLDRAAQMLNKLDSERILENAWSFSQLRDDYFRRDRLVLELLLIAALGLLVVTAIGIAGLASFWVQQRSRSIGIRRAIGATRGDILRYFMVENFLIVAGGIALGMFVAYALNQLLMRHYELPRLPVWYLPIGALALWLVGQLAVLGPALRMAALPPAVASRS